MARFIKCSVCLLGIALATGCIDRSSGSAVVSGDKLVPPATSRVVRNAELSGWDTPTYTRFDGQYPPEWPDDFELPVGVFLKDAPLRLQDAVNAQAQAAGFRLIDFDCMVPLTVEQTVEHFRDQAQQLGATLTRDERVVSQPFPVQPGGLDPGNGLHDMLLENLPESRHHHILIKVWLDEDLGGYTMMSGSVCVVTSV